MTMRSGCLQSAWIRLGSSPGAGSDDHILSGRGIDTRMQLAFQVLPLGGVFLHKIRIGNRRLDFRDEAQPTFVGAGLQPDFLQGRPGIVDGGAHFGLGVGTWIARHHVIAMRQQACGPAAANHSGAD